MARSHQLAEASTLAPLRYASAPLSIFVGIAAFNDHISLNFILGTLVIIGASWYILRREQHLENQPGYSFFSTIIRESSQA